MIIIYNSLLRKKLDFGLIDQRVLLVWYDLLLPNIKHLYISFSMSCLFPVDLEKSEIIPQISDGITCKNVIVIKSKGL